VQRWVEVKPLAVSVLIDLEWSPRAGGHVLCWKRLAEAAAEADLGIDLTVHAEAPEAGVEELSPNVRFVTHRPVFSSSRLGFLDGVAAHTDLAPIHPALFKALRGASIIHTTDAYFAYAKTARLASRLRKVPLVSSLHTNTPTYTRVFAERALERLSGRTLSRALVGKLHLPDRFADRMEHALARHLAVSRWALVSERDRIGDFELLVGSALDEGGSVSVLRRGIDRRLFNPAKRDRGRLAERFAISEDRVVLMFVGRVDEAKGALAFAGACRALLDRGAPVHALVAGWGPQMGDIRDLLGSSVSLPGAVPQQDLAWMEASADLFVFPSRTELVPNAVLEAKASGLCPLVAVGGGEVFVREDGIDGIVVKDPEPTAWAQAIEALAIDPLRRTRIGRAARRDIERHHPTWEEVLRHDLLPVWCEVAHEVGLREQPAWGAASNVR
jgi:glycosyltransferase involved in cell wall biosynthesis